ncbi:MAG: hypothetical protein ABW133_03965 [Polyangiaceae bacterium]
MTQPRGGPARGATAVIALVLGVAAPKVARADADPDPWFGRDKALHFAVAAGIAGTGYGVTTAFADDRWKALAVGGGAAVAAGALKEGIDAAGYGDPSWKDFAWDVAGAVVGVAVAWGVDVLVHGGDPPPLSSSASKGFALRF